MKDLLTGIAVVFSAIAVTAFAALEPPAPAAPAFSAQELAQGYREHVILAKPRADRRGTVEMEERREGLRLARRFERFGDLRALELPPGESADRAIARLRASGRYEYVERDYLRYASIIPDDRRFGDLWALLNTGQSRGVAGADIKAPEAWEIRREAPEVIVAVIDSGVNLTHSDIAGNLWRNPAPTPGINDLHGARFTGGSGRMTSGNPSDDTGHGTHVAGTIGAIGNNGDGTTGVAWKVQIMALKFLTTSGVGSSADGIACIHYAIDHGAHIINASYGANGGSPLSQGELDAIARARELGILFVAAAGNDTANLDVAKHYPAGLPLDNIVSVGASTRTDEPAIFSNYGAATDLFAPGSEIVSLDYHQPSGGTSLKSGTSMAAPHVSGALALLKAQYPQDNYRQLINRLLRGVDRGPHFAGKTQTSGRLNLLQALTASSNRPFNDDFADRPRLAAENLWLRSNNAGATPEPGEPAHGGQLPGSTLWWQWTAAGNTPVTIHTTGSNYNTVLAVYTGDALGALALVAENDDHGTTITSSVSFVSQPGAVYQIAVGGKNGASGSTFVTLNAAPANDHFATPVVLTGASARAAGTNLLCTREPGEPSILGNPGGSSLWYRWTAPKSGRFQASAFTTGFDPLLAVYTGNSLTSLTLVTANDNSGFDHSQRPSLCTFNATAGTTYQITVDAKPADPGGSNAGEFVLTIVDSAWQAATGRSGVTGDAITGAPAIAADGTIYFGSIDRWVYALNHDGTLKWSFSAGHMVDTASPAIGSDGTVYVGTQGGRLLALTPAGTQRWVRDFGTSAPASNSPAIAADGTVYVKVGDGRLHALDPATGATRWAFDVKGPQSYATPVIAPDGTIYQGSDDCSLYAIHPDGTLKWRFATDATGEVYTTPALDAAGNLYFGVLNSGKFYSVTPAGAERWVYTESFESISSSPALSADGRTVYFGSYDRRLHALDTATGVARWTYQLASQVRASSPAVDADGVVYIGAYDSRIHAVNAQGERVRTYDTGAMVRSSPAIFGRRLYIGSNDRKLYAFDLGADSAGGNWPQYRANPRRTGRVLSTPLAITAPVETQIVAIGQPLTLTLPAAGDPPLSYQWFKDGAPVPGATSNPFTVPTAAPLHAGSYTLRVTGPQGSLTSDPIVVRIEPPNPGRLVNLSVRTTAGTGLQTLIVGFAVAGEPDKPVLVRGIGPSLAQFGLTGLLADPRLQLLAGDVVLLANDDWGSPAAGIAQLAAAFAATGAFPLAEQSADAALVRAMHPGSYTAQISGTSDTGLALAELYDTAPAGGARLVNASARAQVGTGMNVLIAGFTLSGNLNKRILLRGIGPALTAFGITGALANPRLEVFRGDIRVRENDDWGGTAELRAAFSASGAFALLNPASRDSALIVELAPGSYTAQVSGVGGMTGVGLIEVYELP